MMPEMTTRAAALLDAYKAKRLKIATAESCTGGLVAALLTEISGSSAVVERGFAGRTDTPHARVARAREVADQREVLEVHRQASAVVADQRNGAIRKRDGRGARACARGVALGDLRRALEPER